jgi:hypothetical protein
MKKKFLNNFIIAILIILGVFLFSYSAQAKVLQFKNQNNEPKNIFASFVDGKLPFNLSNFAPGMKTSTEVITITNEENYEIEVDFKTQKRSGSNLLADNLTVNLTNQSAHLSSLFNNHLSLVSVASGQSVPYDVSIFFDKVAGNECQGEFIEFDFVITVFQEDDGGENGTGEENGDGNGEGNGDGNGEGNGEETSVTIPGGGWSYRREEPATGAEEDSGEEESEEESTDLEPAVAGESTTAPEEGGPSPTGDYDYPGRELFGPETGGTGEGITGEGEGGISPLIGGFLPQWLTKVLEEAESSAEDFNFLAAVGNAWQNLNKPAFFSLLGIILAIVLALLGIKAWRRRTSR